MGLETYIDKRNFSQTTEPKGSEVHPSGDLKFVVQRHQASRLHYDFRLEMERVLKSWAIPKGPSMNPADKRLSIMVEDHPLEYRTFEGEIAPGNYGAGTVEIWDEGTYYAENTTDRIQSENALLEGLQRGNIKFVLNGKKLKGAFTLIELPRGEEYAWLLMKQKDSEATDEPYRIENLTQGKPQKNRSGQQADPGQKQLVSTESTSHPSTHKKTKKESTNEAHSLATPEGPETREEKTIDGKTLTISNLQKLYWPDEGYTKGDLIAYYQQMAPYILPYLKDRPQNLHRHPNGIYNEGFYQKDAGKQVPEWIKTVEIYSDSSTRNVNDLVCQDAATLAYLNNLGCIEIHPWNSRISSLKRPDYLVIDLDPGENTYDEVVEVALVVKEEMDKAGATCFCKTSGATGLHIYAPLNAKYEFDQAEAFAKRIAERVHAYLPGLTSLERSPKMRRKQVYLDFLQNNIAQTLAAPYSVRPKPGASVSTPLDWSEVKAGLRPAAFTIKTVPERVKEKGELFTGVLGEGIDLVACMKKLD